MSPKAYTTGEAAKEVGITRATLQAWIRRGKITAPKPTFRGAVGVRLWTELAITRLRRQKEKIYKKELGRPPKNRKK
jgi:excisionase family DNA binding protein